MNKLWLLIGASLRSQLRWAREHIYYWLVLGPLVIGFTTKTLARVVDNLSAWQPAPSTFIAASLVFEFALIALSLSRSATEIYHLRRPEAYTEALPVKSITHLHAAMAARLGRTLVVAIVAPVAHWMAGAEWIDPMNWPVLALFVCLTALAEMFAALNWIHWGHTRQKAVTLVALLLVLPTAGISGLLFALVVKDGLFSSGMRIGLMGLAALGVVVLYVIIRLQHDRWRAADIEYAQRLQTSNRLALVSVERLRRRLGYAVAAQLARDLQLTLRAFSSAVYVVAGIAVMLLAGLVVALTTHLLQAPGNPTWLDMTWTPQALATKSACAVMTATLVTLVPLLVAYELPMMWVERSTAITGLDLCMAKLWYARIISLPAPLAAWVAGLLTLQVPIMYQLPLLAECLWLWWLMSSLMGWMAFEMPARPGLAIIVINTMMLAAASLGVIFWPAGLIIYVQATHSLSDRGRAMARLYLLTEGN